jgi:hypothetical protein
MQHNQLSLETLPRPRTMHDTRPRGPDEREAHIGPPGTVSYSSWTRQSS